MNAYKNAVNVKRYIIGKGASRQLTAILEPRRKMNSGKVVFIVDHFFDRKTISDRVGIKETDLFISLDTTNEPHADVINSVMTDLCAPLAGELPSVIVGIGGGSTMDVAKAVSVLFMNTGSVEQYQGWDLVKNPAVYKIGVPTISGTGAEATRTAVLTSKIQKLGINSDFSVFDQVIMDPEFLESVPKEQFFWTAMDCYIHDVESLRGSMIDEMCRAYAEKSRQLLQEIFGNEMNYEKLMVASYFGGCAVANSNVGVCHPLSYGLSLVLGLHHGIANCIAFNKLDEYYEKDVPVFRAMAKKMGVIIPSGVMKDVTDEQIGRMIAATLKNEKPLTNAFGPNWRDIFTPAKVEALLRSM